MKNEKRIYIRNVPRHRDASVTRLESLLLKTLTQGSRDADASRSPVHHPDIGVDDGGHLSSSSSLLVVLVVVVVGDVATWIVIVVGSSWMVG